MKIQTLNYNHTAAIIQHYSNLTKLDKIMRFSSNKSIDSLTKFYNNLNWDLNSFFAVISDEEIIALLQLGFSKDKKTAEIGISVLPTFRQMGLAQKLILHGIDYCQKIGTQKVFMTGLAENTNMLRLAKKLDFHTACFRGEFEAFLSFNN